MLDDEEYEHILTQDYEAHIKLLRREIALRSVNEKQMQSKIKRLENPSIINRDNLETVNEVVKWKIRKSLSRVAKKVKALKHKIGRLFK